MFFDWTCLHAKSTLFLKGSKVFYSKIDEHISFFFAKIANNRIDGKNFEKISQKFPSYKNTSIKIISDEVLAPLLIHTRLRQGLFPQDLHHVKSNISPWRPHCKNGQIIVYLYSRLKPMRRQEKRLLDDPSFWLHPRRFPPLFVLKRLGLGRFSKISPEKLRARFGTGYVEVITGWFEPYLNHSSRILLTIRVFKILHRQIG